MPKFLRWLFGDVCPLCLCKDHAQGPTHAPFGLSWSVHHAQGPHPLILDEAFGFLYVYRGPGQALQPYMDRQEAGECAKVLAYYAEIGELPETKAAKRADVAAR